MAKLPLRVQWRDILYDVRTLRPVVPVRARTADVVRTTSTARGVSMTST